MSCHNSCNQGTGSFCPQKKTWTPGCGSLSEGYVGKDGCITGYGKGCGCGHGNDKNLMCGCDLPKSREPFGLYDSATREPYYHSLNSEWRTSTNVTPANHDFRYDAHWRSKTDPRWKKKVKENFAGSDCCNGNPTDYSLLKGAWSSQKRYTS